MSAAMGSLNDYADIGSGDIGHPGAQIVVSDQGLIVQQEHFVFAVRFIKWPGVCNTSTPRT